MPDRIIFALAILAWLCGMRSLYHANRALDSAREYRESAEEAEALARDYCDAGNAAWACAMDVWAQAIEERQVVERILDRPLPGDEWKHQDR